MNYIKIIGAILLIFSGMYLGAKVGTVDAIIIGIVLIVGFALFNIDAFEDSITK